MVGSFTAVVKTAAFASSPMRLSALFCSALLLIAAGRAQAAPDAIDLPAKDGTLHAYLYKPGEGAGPFPTVVAVHGCSGLAGRSGPVQSRYQNWADILTKAGYAVLFPDSYGSRNLGSQCRVHERSVHASRERVTDILAARRWLADQAWVRHDRISLLGWSNGGNGLLWAVRPQAAVHDGAPDFRTAVALYPDCRRNSRLAWSARVPTLILIGAADDWSPARDCQQMIDAARGRSALARVIVYPGAYQDFDRDNLALQERTGMATSRDGSGRVHIGTNEPARSDALKRVPEWLGQ
jgi:dienelactone hydrolase